MKFIESRQNRRPAPILVDDAFEQLRQAFNSRLRSDRVHLADLGTALTRAAAEPESIFEEIGMFAHKLRGAAAIFEAAEIGKAAMALELAATAASIAGAQNTDPPVWATLEALADRLASATGCDVSPIPAMMRRQATL
jgi:HPt (histidine-containing phosphotransfer) domain-containing protein